MNKLSIIGQMTELVLKPITRSEFKTLKQEGVEGHLYDRLIKETDREPSYSFGYSTLAHGSNFEVYLNNEPLHIKRSVIKCFRGIHKPIVHIKDSWNLVTQRTYSEGLSVLELDDDFDPSHLAFERKRCKISGIGFSVVVPSYLDQPIPFISAWTDRESNFIV